MHFLRSKLPSVGTTIFTVMSALAAEHRAVNLSQGFPDFEAPQKLIALVEKYMRAGYNQYAPMAGVLPLREALSDKAERLYGRKYDANTEITITSGATQAIYTAISCSVHPGEEVIIIEPAYDCYAPAVELCGGVPVFVGPGDDGKADWNKVRAKVNDRTRMIVINTPNNPAGHVFTAEDMRQLTGMVRGTGILICSDEVYEHVIFDGRAHESVMRHEELAKRSFAVFSFGKTCHVTGWKTGYCMAPAELMSEFRKVHQFVVFCSNPAIQYALADYLALDDWQSLSSFYQAKRDYFNSLIKDSRFRLQPSEGSYFQLLDYSDISEEDDMSMAFRLTKESGVASVPVSAFYHNPPTQKFLRFCFAKREETLEKAAELLRAV